MRRSRCDCGGDGCDTNSDGNEFAIYIRSSDGTYSGANESAELDTWRETRIGGDTNSGENECADLGEGERENRKRGDTNSGENECADRGECELRTHTSGATNSGEYLCAELGRHPESCTRETDIARTAVTGSSEEEEAEEEAEEENSEDESDAKSIDSDLCADALTCIRDAQAFELPNSQVVPRQRDSESFLSGLEDVNLVEESRKVLLLAVFGRFGNLVVIGQFCDIYLGSLASDGFTSLPSETSIAGIDVTFVFFCFPMFSFVFPCFRLFSHVFFCFQCFLLFSHVFFCFPMFSYIFFCFPMFSFVFQCFLLFSFN